MKKVLIVDDSELVRRMLSKILDAAPELKVVGTAADAYEARKMIKMLDPDVITLDVEMPRMDGITFLGNLMRLRPLPVVMVSSLTEKGAEITLRALELGAVDFVAKPNSDTIRGFTLYADELTDKVIAAAGARVRALEQWPRRNTDPGMEQNLSAKVRRVELVSGRIIGIGASTGGTEAIKEILRELPPCMPGIVVCQHIPAAFSAPFAARADRQSRLTVSEAKDGEQILKGHVYIAPGNRHLLVERHGPRYFCQLDDGPAVNRHRPSVDVMFRSLAQNARSNAVCVVLTGMGSDGAAGMGELKGTGGYNLVQDEKSSVVWGMPGEAVKRGFADEVLGLRKISKRLVQLSQQ